MNTTVGEKTNLIGSVIGGGNTTLRTGELEYSDIYDKDKGYNFGINGSASFSKNDKGEWDISKSIGANYGATDREQINRATIGAGTVIVGGETVNPNINRDESKAQIITRDIDTGNIKLEYKDNRRKWSDVSDIMGEYGKSLGSDLDKMSGGKYDLENKLSETFKKTYLGFERLIGKELGMDILGIIPTKRSYGGLAGALQGTGTADGFIAELEIGGSNINKDGSINIDSVMREMSNEEIMKIKDGLNMVNGVLNFEDTVAISAANQSLDPRVLKELKDNPNKKVKMKVFFNPSHGIIADVIESALDVTGFYTGGLIRSSNSKKLAELAIKNPELYNGTLSHSQGSAILGNSMKVVNLKGKKEVLQGKDISMNGSPLSMWAMRNFAEEKGFKFSYKVNVVDPITWLGANKWNTDVWWHTTYSKYQKYDKKTNKYFVSPKSKEERVLIKDVKDFRKETL